MKQSIYVSARSDANSALLADGSYAYVRLFECHEPWCHKRTYHTQFQLSLQTVNSVKYWQYHYYYFYDIG